MMGKKKALTLADLEKAYKATKAQEPNTNYVIPKGLGDRFIKIGWAKPSKDREYLVATDLYGVFDEQD